MPETILPTTGVATRKHLSIFFSGYLVLVLYIAKQKLEGDAGSRLFHSNLLTTNILYILIN